MQPVMDNVLYFLAGAILANGTPHLINGLSGRYWPEHSRLISGAQDAYRRKALGSSPVANVIWGTINMTAASLLILGIGDFDFGISLDPCCLFLGLLLGGIYLAWNFTEK